MRRTALLTCSHQRKKNQRVRARTKQLFLKQRDSCISTSWTCNPVKIPIEFWRFQIKALLCPRQRAIETGWWLSVGNSLISKSRQNEEMRTVASSSLGFAACLSKNPDFSQSSELPLFTKGLRFYPKLRNNADIGK